MTQVAQTNTDPIVAREEGALEFLQTVLSPSDFNQPPPNIYNQPCFTKNVSVSGNWLIGTATGTIKDNSGLLIWSVCDGVADIQRYGILRDETNVSLTVLSDASSIGIAQGGPIIPTLDGLTGLELAVPVLGSIEIAPDLGQQFSVCRTYAGRLSLISDAVPIGNTALTGRFAAGSISDMRDLIPVNQAVFSETDLVQQSITGKDGIKGVKVDQGIVTLLGPDLNPAFSAPDRNTTIYAGHSDREVVSTTIQGGQVTGVTLLRDNFVSLLQYAFTQPVFFTPYAPLTVSFLQSGNPYILLAQTAQMSMLPLKGRASLQIQRGAVTMRIGNSAHAYGPFTWGLQTVATHVYLSTDENGSANVSFGSSATVEQSSAVSTNVPSGNTTQQLFPPVSLSIPSEVDAGGTAGLYIGTIVNVKMQILETTLTGTPQTDIPDFVLAFDKYDISATITAEDIYDSGKLGPTRVLRWDNVSNGQTIKLDGIILAQCVPEGNLAPFVVPSAQLNPEYMQLNVYPWVSKLFNGTSEFRRNWRGTEYQEFIQDRVRELRSRGIKGLEDMELKHGEAAGLFETLGGVLGASYGGPLGGALGTIAGSLGDKFIGGHASGSFPVEMSNAGYCGGQFGLAAGSFERGSETTVRRSWSDELMTHGKRRKY